MKRQKPQSAREQRRKAARDGKRAKLPPVVRKVFDGKRIVLVGRPYGLGAALHRGLIAQRAAEYLDSQTMVRRALDAQAAAHGEELNP